MDPILLLLIAVLGVFIVFQFIQGRKRRRETEERQAAFVPGVEIMTNYGLYGTIVSIDEERNLAVLETSPGQTVKVHRQTLLKVADYDTPAATSAEATDDDATDEELEPVQDAATGASVDRPAATAAEPAYGERIDDDTAAAAGDPARRADPRGPDARPAE